MQLVAVGFSGARSVLAGAVEVVPCGLVGDQQPEQAQVAVSGRVQNSAAPSRDACLCAIELSASPRIGASGVVWARRRHALISPATARSPHMSSRAATEASAATCLGLSDPRGLWAFYIRLKIEGPYASNGGGGIYPCCDVSGYRDHCDRDGRDDRETAERYEQAKGENHWVARDGYESAGHHELAVTKAAPIEKPTTRSSALSISSARHTAPSESPSSLRSLSQACAALPDHRSHRRGHRQHCTYEHHHRDPRELHEGLGSPLLTAVELRGRFDAEPRGWAKRALDLALDSCGRGAGGEDHVAGARLVLPHAWRVSAALRMIAPGDHPMFVLRAATRKAVGRGAGSVKDCPMWRCCC